MSARELVILLESDDEAEETCAKKLYMFLYHTKAHARAPDLSAIFNAEFPFENIINTSAFVLGESEQEYESIVSANVVEIDGERYVHTSNLSTNKVMNRRLNRCLEKMPKLATRAGETCPLHSKKCQLL